MSNKQKYFNYDSCGMLEDEIAEQLPFAITRLIEELPSNVRPKDVEFGVDAQYSRDPFDQEPNYFAWVSEREKF